MARGLSRTAAIGASLSIALTLCIGLAAPAAAHVHVDADNLTPGSTAVLTFQVPGESETGAFTTQLSVALPNVASARTELAPGWVARLDRDVNAGTVHGVTWTAAPGVGITSEQFALFRISVTLPEQPTVSFPTTQTYSDGQVVQWDQLTPPGGPEPERPAPTLTLKSPPPKPESSPEASNAPSTVDNSGRWLAGGALVMAAVAVVAAMLARRRP